MRRREILSVIVTAAAWATGGPLAHAQSGSTPVVGFISATAETGYGHLVDAFREGLAQSGFVEGKNVRTIFRWADGDYGRLQAFANELATRNVMVVLAASLPAALAAKAATATIPIVFLSGADPVRFGIVRSLANPGGNATGIAQLYGDVGGKRLQLISEIVPSAARVAILINRKNPNASEHLDGIEKTGRALGISLLILDGGDDAEIEIAFEAMTLQAGALLVVDDPYLRQIGGTLVSMANAKRIPAIYFAREFVLSGGLASYASSSEDNYRKAGVYVAQILKGARPAEMPVLQPTEFKLTINLRTSRVLGLTIPPTLLARADEVID